MGIDPLNSVDNAAMQVKKAKTEKVRLTIIKKYMDGQPDPTTDAGKQLLQRRALFCTAVRDFWPGDDSPDESEELVLV